MLLSTHLVKHMSGIFFFYFHVLLDENITLECKNINIVKWLVHRPLQFKKKKSTCSIFFFLYGLFLSIISAYKLHILLQHHVTTITKAQTLELKEERR